MRSPAEMMLMIEKLKAEVKALRAQLEEHGIKPNISSIKLKDFEAPAEVETIEETKEEFSHVEEDQSAVEETEVEEPEIKESKTDGDFAAN